MPGFLTTLWQRLEGAIKGKATSVKTVVSDVEQVVLQEVHPFVQQVENTIGAAGIDTVKTLLTAGVAALVPGGPALSAVISDVATNALSGVETALLDDAKNAVYGLIAILLPGVQAAAVASGAIPKP